MAKESKKPRRKILDAARKHQDALQAAGLSVVVIERYENALKGLSAQGKEIPPAAQVTTSTLMPSLPSTRVGNTTSAGVYPS